MRHFIAWLAWQFKWGWELDYEAYVDGAGEITQEWVNRETGETRVRVIKWR